MDGATKGLALMCVGIILFFAVLIGHAFYSNLDFRQRCDDAGGRVVQEMNKVCVSSTEVLFSE